MSTNNNLSTNQRKAIAAIMAHPSIPKAAAACKMSFKTLYRWMEEPEFRAELIQAEGDAIDQATRQLVMLQDPAISVFARSMAPDQPASIRLRAATAILDFMIRIRELRNMEQRLADLEEQVYGREQTT